VRLNSEDCGTYTSAARLYTLHVPPLDVRADQRFNQQENRVRSRLTHARPIQRCACCTNTVRRLPGRSRCLPPTSTSRQMPLDSAAHASRVGIRDSVIGLLDFFLAYVTKGQAGSRNGTEEHVPVF
jgi:hypothetical protein